MPLMNMMPRQCIDMPAYLLFVQSCMQVLDGVEQVCTKATALHRYWQLIDESSQFMVDVPPPPISADGEPELCVVCRYVYGLLLLRLLITLGCCSKVHLVAYQGPMLGRAILNESRIMWMMHAVRP